MRTLTHVNQLKDKRVGCYSVMVYMPIPQYLELVEKAYSNKGGLEGQREALRTSTAIRIRKRLVSDLQQGAVMPPVVLGLIVDQESFSILKDEISAKDFNKLLSSISEENISIIDGMQRTTALKEAMAASPSEDMMRVEFWVSTNINSLIYRMLILNTGQVPWNLRRQLEVVYKSMLAELKEHVPELNLAEIDDGTRRSTSGQFQADQIIELFLVFGARKEKIDIKERLAEEFTRLDFIEVTGDSHFMEIFFEVVGYLVRLDKVLFSARVASPEGLRFASGKDLWSSQPARVGFVTAIGQQILGRPGINISAEAQAARRKEVRSNIEAMLKRLEGLEIEQRCAFMDFSTLNEAISRPSGRVGDFEREFFLKAFKVLVEESFELEYLTACWRAF